MRKREPADPRTERAILAKLLHDDTFDSRFVGTMLDVYKKVCRALEVSDGADPVSSRVASTVILLAIDGVRDPDVLYSRTVAAIQDGK